MLWPRTDEPGWFFWELFESWKKLYLVGFAVLVLPGEIEQLVISFLVALAFFLLLSIAMPYQQVGDDYFAKARRAATHRGPSC